MKYLIKLGSEVTIKSDAVRKNCIKLLKKNILNHLDFYQIDGILKWDWDRIVLEVSDQEDQAKIISIIENISGIEYFSPIIDYELSEEIMNEDTKIFDEISRIAREYFEIQIEDKSFVVRIHRVWRHNFKSTDLERYVGWKLFENAKNTSVSLHNPDVTVQMDLRDNIICILTEKIKGTSWYPVGFQSNLLSLISGWFDSSVSSHALIKRGCKIDYLFFNLWGDAHELWVKQMSYHIWSHFSIPYKRAKFISVPFDEVLWDIIKNIPSRFRAIVLKRCMLKVASQISMQYYCGVIKWDSVGQVSSQTLQNLKVVDDASEAMVLRPLVGMNKNDIMDIAREIGTYDAAAAMPEYCWVVSQRPETKAQLQDVLDAEENLSKNILEKAHGNRVIQRVSDMLFSDNKTSSISEIQQAWDEIIIDIREEDRVKKSPLTQKWVEESIWIPFYEINHTFAKLDQTQQYAFYCDKWVLSHLHGLYLKEKWFTNIKVFRP